MGNLPLRMRKKSRALPSARVPVIAADLDLEDFPEQISLFVEDIAVLLTCLNEFPEFVNDTVNASIAILQADLGVGAGICDS